MVKKENPPKIFQLEKQLLKTAADPSTYDPNRGIGKFTTVELGANLDVAWLQKEKKSKCKMFFLS